VALFRGAFLSGFYLKHCPVFEDWQLREEENLRFEQISVLRRLVQVREAGAQYEQATVLAERLVALDPAQEAYRYLMRLHALRGQWSRALLQYERCREMLARDLGEQPDAQTRELFEQIRARRIPPGEIRSDERREIHPAVAERAPREGVSVWLLAGDDKGRADCTPAPAIDAGIAEALRMQAAASHRARVVLTAGSGDSSGAGPSEIAAEQARGLLDASHPGQVLVSAEAAELVAGTPQGKAALLPLGSHRMRNLGPPVSVFQLLHPDLRTGFPPLRTLDSVPNNLRCQPTRLLGRSSELAEITRLLTDDAVRLLTLTGAGGTGKTRLALQAAAAVALRFVDGVFFVDLSALRDPARVVPAIAGALNVLESSGRDTPLLDLVRDRLGGRRTLLLLDNFEHLVPAAPDIVDLLAACPETRVLVTSREALRVRGERLFEVPPLGLPNPGARLPEDADCDAVRLLVERGRAVRPGFALDRGNAAAVAAICQHLDGLPLAIELAATHLAVLSVEELRERLVSRLSLLVDGSRDLPPRQRALRSTLDWSYSLLDDRDRRLFARLSVFRGVFTLPDAERVCAGAGADASAVREALSSLAAQHLVVRDEVAGTSWFGMLETVAEYARELLALSGEAAELAMRHARHCLATSETVRPLLRGPQQVAWLDRIELEIHSLRTAMDTLCTQGRAEEAQRLAAALDVYWYRRGHFQEGAEWLARALAMEGPLPAEAAARRAYGEILFHGGDWPGARSHLARSRALYRDLGMGQEEAHALAFQSVVERSLGSSPLALEYAEEAVRIARQSADPWHMAYTLLVAYATTGGDYAGAPPVAELHESLALFQEVGDAWGVAHAQDGLGDLSRKLGQYAEARRRYEEALVGFHEVKDRWMIAWASEALASVHEKEGSIGEAEDSYRQAIRLFHALGDSANTILMLARLARTARAQGDHRRAASLLSSFDSLRKHATAIRGSRRADAEMETARAGYRSSFRREWSSAQLMGLHEAVDLALRGERAVTSAARSD
jgi:predicted ATPase